MSAYLGIDLGTQGLKAVIYNAQSRAIEASASSPLALISDTDGTREQLAEWWLTALQDAMAQLSATSKSHVVCIGVSGQQHGFVPVDASGAVVAPVKLWCDTATHSQCAQITEAFGGEARCISEAGNPILPGYTASKIRWLRENRPGAYAAMSTILLPHDYLNFYLTGELAMECGDASGTGLLDIRERRWHTGMLQALDSERDLSQALPRLLAPGEVLGTVRSEVAAQLGLPDGVRVATGGGDNMMAALGTGNYRPGRLTVSLGTSGTLFAYADHPCIDAEGELAAFCSSDGGWLPLLCTMNCTVATEIARDLLGSDLASLEQSVARAAPGANGVIALPFYNGERTPNLPNGKGCILGLNPQNATSDNILRASMEAAVFGLYTGIAAFDRVGCSFEEIRLTGGGSNSAVWRQIIADVFALPVHTLALDEGAALGAALNALITDQQCDSTELDAHVVIDDAASTYPTSVNGDVYQQTYRQYLDYIEMLSPAFQ